MYGAVHEMVKVGVVSVVVRAPAGRVGAVGVGMLVMSVKIWIRLLLVSTTYMFPAVLMAIP